MSLEIAIRCEKISNSVGIVNSDASECGRSNNVTKHCCCSSDWFGDALVSV